MNLPVPQGGPAPPFQPHCPLALVRLPPFLPPNIVPCCSPHPPSGQPDYPGPGEYDPAAFRDTGPAFTMGTLPKVGAQCSASALSCLPDGSPLNHAASCAVHWCAG